MKHRILIALEALLLCAAVTVGAMGALAGVYALPMTWQIPGLCWSLSFLLGLVLFPRRKGGMLLLGIVCFLSGFFLWWPESRSQTLSLLEILSKQLNGVYHLGYLEFPNHTLGSVELPMAFGGSCLVLAVCRSVVGRKSSALPLLLSLPPLLLCGLLSRFSPKPWTVFMWLFGILLLLLSSGSRKNSALQGLTLTAMALIPVSLLCGILYAAVPQQAERDYSLALRERCIRYFTRSAPAAAPAAVPAPELQRSVDLAALRGGNQPSLPVLIVTSPSSGSLYLRGQSYDRYTATGWEMSSETPDSFDGWGESPGDVQIRTFALQSVLYLPYYPGTGTVLTGGALKNTGSILSYSFPMYPSGSAASAQTLADCLTLPDSTRAWASAYGFSGDTPGEIAEKIGAFVRESARYDKSTGACPEGRDFARWFLEDSDTGYCVHYATAATVLLRAAGVPARYVTGFRCEARAGQPLIVTTEEAHAWAEYYDSALGSWQILEATAPGSTPTPAVTPATRPTQSAQPTQAAPTEAAPPAASAAPVPSGQAAPGRGPGPLWLLLLPAALPLLRQGVLLLRRQRIRRSGLNRRCLLYWVRAERLSSALGIRPPEALKALAERARYSRHRLTPMELIPLTDYCDDCREKLEQKGLLKRLWNRYIRMLY